MNFKQPVMAEVNGVHLFSSQHLHRFEDVTCISGKF